MMASVFFMQPLGQIAGNLVSLIVVAASRSQGYGDLTRTADSMWRWVIGVGVVPGVIATLFRFVIPETPRFLLEIDDDPITAEFDATAMFNDPTPSIVTSPLHDNDSWSHLPLPAISLASQSICEERSPSQTAIIQPPTLNSHWHLTKRDIVQYFWTEGNWRTLVATSLSWLLLDFGFYGIGLSNPQFLAKTWGSLKLQGPAPTWKTDDSPSADFYQMFLDCSTHALVILNSGSFLGGLLLILVVHRLDRVGLQKYGFLALAAHFIALGTMFITVHKEGPVAVVLYILGQALFNFGMSLHPPPPHEHIPNEVRPQRNNLHDPSRDLPHPLPRHLPRHQRRGRQTRLNPGAGALGVLQIWLGRGRRADHPPRLDPDRLQRVHGAGGGRDAFLDPAGAAR
jgi:hypothetical protein